MTQAHDFAGTPVSDRLLVLQFLRLLNVVAMLVVPVAAGVETTRVVVIALVYVPILALQSVEGRMFRPMAMTVLFALGSAFVLSITLVPALASLLLKKHTVDKESFVMRWAHKIYKPGLERVMAWPKLVIGVALVLFSGSIVLGGSMGREFLPKLVPYECAPTRSSVATLTMRS